MITVPYFPPYKFHLIGPFDVTIFGIMVVTGIMVGSWLTSVRGKQLGLQKESIFNMIFACVVTGMISAHLFDAIFYPTVAHKSFLDLLKSLVDIRSGLSSYGGFLGAIVALFVWCRINKVSILPYADSLAFGLAAGWTFGRLGCFSAHDHPGKLLIQHDLTNKFTAFLVKLSVRVNYGPVLGIRHDLGLYEAMGAAVLCLIFITIYFTTKKSAPRAGFYVAFIATFYGPLRLCLDALRATDLSGSDPRMLGLTLAQYLSIFVTIIGIVLWFYLYNKKRSPAISTKSK